jgi:hypothetical protein
MTKGPSIPTKQGDVLILVTQRSFQAYIVGIVSRDAQQDFHRATGMTYASDAASALVLAKELVLPGRNIFLRHLDRDTWMLMSE